MQNVFIGVGGSGTKVAEALVRLLAIGFPTRIDENGIITSSGDSLQIWRLDPDRSSGSAAALNRSLEEYKELQRHLGYINGDIAGSQWAMDIDTEVRHLDPLEISSDGGSKKEAKTLRSLLSFGGAGKQDARPFLDAFYEEKELEVNIDRGFYQKPFIGAAVMAIFAKTLEDENSPGGNKVRLTSLSDREVRFFLCGSLNGGTGACGVPILGKFLSDSRIARGNRPWKIGACLLAPYCIPPEPPFNALEEEEVTPERIEEFLHRYSNVPAFSDLSTEEKRGLVKQILLGFYADPKEMVDRTRQNLSYYKDHPSMQFDDLYLVGKREPDKLEKWSNGGKNQSNPLNSAEVVAAITALQFFSGSIIGKQDSYVIATSTSTLSPQKMHLHHLPRYRIAGAIQGGIEVDPERVFLATGILHHVLRQQIPWSVDAKRWSGIEGLRNYYQNDEPKKDRDLSHYQNATNQIAKLVLSIIDPGQTMGWDADDLGKISGYFSEEFNQVNDITDKISKKYRFSPNKEAKGPLVLGESSIKVSASEFGDWTPPKNQYDRGYYMRFLWSNFFSKHEQ